MKETENPTVSFEFRKWISFIAIAICYSLVHFHRYSPSVLSQDMSISLNVSISKLGFFSSMYFWSYAAIQPIIGCIADVLDPGIIIGISGIVSSIGSFICGIAPNFLIASIGRFLVGIGVSCTYVSVCRFMANWFTPTSYTLINSILLSIGGLGGIASQRPLLLLGTLIGWRWSLIIISICSLISSLISLFFVRGSPVTLGYPLVEGTLPPKKLESFNILFFAALSNLKEVFSVFQFWIHALSIFFATSCYQNVSGMWAVSYLMDSFGFSREKSSSITISLIIVMIIGSPLLGFISYSFGMKKSLNIIITIIGILITLIFFLINSNLTELSLYPLFFFFGVATISTQSFTMPMFKEMVHSSLTATILGCGNTFIFLGGAIAQSLTSFLLSYYGNSPYKPIAYKYSLWLVCLISLILSLILTILLPYKQYKEEEEEENHEEDKSVVNEL